MALKISVTVKPQSKKEEVKKISEGEYLISVHAPARQGEANEALVEILARHFSVPKSSIQIIRGQTNRRKLVKIG